MLPLLALVAVLAFAPAAQARTGPCRVDVADGPTCHVWTGKMTHVADGDGLYVDLRGDGTRKARLVRVTGIQAMELTRYSHTPSRRRGACHAREATAALEQLVGDRRVRLAAQDLGRTDLGRRVRRHLAVRLAGHWVDAGLRLLEQGHALWLPNSGERAWNELYGEAARRGSLSGRNLYDPASCGVGPGSELAPQVSVNWDADGSDGQNVNGEYVRVRNASDSALGLGGWWVRDSALRRFTFPAGTSIAPGDSLLMRVGTGHADGRTFHWGQARPVFENSGDGAYLFDPQGDLRAFEIYP